MDVRIKSAIPGLLIWAVFIATAVCMIYITDLGKTESFLMLLFGAFSATIATEGFHEVLGHRPLGTLKEFSSMTREELSFFNERRIFLFNGILHIAAAVLISLPTILRAFYTETLIIIPFFYILIPVAIMLAIGSYSVNYSRIFRTVEGRKKKNLRDLGAAGRTTIALLTSIGVCYGLARLFMLL